jgi:polyribonucleotide nucleotidyltransferase
MSGHIRKGIDNMSGLLERLEARIEALEAEVERLKDVEQIGSLVEGYKYLYEDVSDNTQQLTRDDIVKKAKDDIEELRNDVGCYTQSDQHGTTKYAQSEYVINREKRTVVALLRGKMSGTFWAKGIATCAPGDVFNAHIGKAIALRRALGLEVPTEYTNAPKPTEARVGDVVRAIGEELRILDENRLIDRNDGLCHINSWCAKNGKIIDDTVSTGGDA